MNLPANEIHKGIEDPIDHPPHYGGADDPYEAIKVIEAYLRVLPRQNPSFEDLKKSAWYLNREIERLEKA